MPTTVNVTQACIDRANRSWDGTYCPIKQAFADLGYQQAHITWTEAHLDGLWTGYPRRQIRLPDVAIAWIRGYHNWLHGTGPKPEPFAFEIELPD